MGQILYYCSYSGVITLVKPPLKHFLYKVISNVMEVVSHGKGKKAIKNCRWIKFKLKIKCVLKC